MAANNAFAAAFGFAPPADGADGADGDGADGDGAAGPSLFDLAEGRWNVARLRQLLEQDLTREREVFDYPIGKTSARTGARSPGSRTSGSTPAGLTPATATPT